MVVSVCRYENNEFCELLKVKCEPGRKGCVLVKNKFAVTELKSKIKTPPNKRKSR